MIGDGLINAIRVAREAALRDSPLCPAALDAVGDAVDLLLDLPGDTAAPLRQAGQRMAATLYRAQIAPGERMLLLTQLTEEALLVGRLERVLPCRDAPGRMPSLHRHRLPNLPQHWLPQVAAARHRPFAVVQGGRA